MELWGHDVPFDEGDDGSLFGSPPPSPSCEHSRSPSPGLALPNTSSAVNVSIISGAGADGSASRHSSAMTNVGTIALPGSQSVSELSFPPLALSWSQGGATNSVHPMNSRPPAIFETASDIRDVSEESGSPASSSRSSTLDPSKPRKARKRKRAVTPIQPAPEISIPDPSQPLPPHFLRNQENLLGRAGLVSRVKASSLARQPHLSSAEQPGARDRGRTPSDPIVIEDGDSQQQYPGQSLSHRHRLRRNVGASSRSPPRTRKPIDLSLLTAPSNQEIVKVLIGQKDIFPVLQSILKLLAGDTVPPPQPSAFQRGLPKKRKLNRVPAGAADWDVPFPFAQGEGPEEYYKNWKKERAKELVSQLLSLIKAAATKAAIRAYYRRQEEEEPGQIDKPTKSCHDSGNSGGQGATNAPASFDQLIASLLSAAPGSSQHQTPPLQPNIAATNLDPQALDASSTSFNMDILSSSLMPPTPAPEADQPLFNSWMSFLQNFPVSFDQNFLGPPTPATTHSSQRNTPMPVDTGFSLSEFGTQAGEDFERMMSSMFGEAAVGGDQSLDGLHFGAMDIDPPPNSCGDDSMDPLFLSLTNANAFPSASTTCFSPPPTDIQVGPILDFSNFPDCGNFQFNGPNVYGDGILSPACTSTTSYSGDTVTGPTTPTSSNWDGVNVAGDGGMVNSLRMEGMWDFWGNTTAINGGVTVNEQTLIDAFAQSEKERSTDTFSEHVTKEPMMPRTATTPRPASAPVRQEEPPSMPETIQETTALVQEALSSLRNFGKMTPAPPRISNKKPESRETILVRVEEKKKRVKEQLDKVKRELWEVTIEQATLVRLCTGMSTSTSTIISTSNTTSNS